MVFWSKLMSDCIVQLEGNLAFFTIAIAELLSLLHPLAHALIHKFDMNAAAPKKMFTFKQLRQPL